MHAHPLDPAVAEDFLLREPEVFLEQEDLLHGRGIQFFGQGVVPFPRGYSAAVGDRGNAHVHVIQPHGIGRRPHPGEDAVGQAVFFLVHEIEPAVQLGPPGFRAGRVAHGRLLHRGDHGAAVVQETGTVLAAHGVGRAEGFPGRIETVLDIFQETLVPGRLIQFQEAGVGNAPLVGKDEELSFWGNGLGRDARVALDEPRDPLGHFQCLPGRVRPLGKGSGGQRQGENRH